LNLTNGPTVQDILDELQDGRLSAEMRAIAFANGGSESFVHNAIVPLPPAVWAGLALLGCVGAFRLRSSRRAL
jgi:hypothetical protein